MTVLHTILPTSVYFKKTNTMLWLTEKEHIAFAPILCTKLEFSDRDDLDPYIDALQPPVDNFRCPNSQKRIPHADCIIN